MSSGERRVPWEFANSIARHMVKVMNPWFDRLEIAGSVRRKREDVGDIELVGIPSQYTMGGIDHAINAYGQPPVLRYREAAHGGLVARGERYRALYEPDAKLNVDLFIVRPPAQWGLIFCLRTGPAEFGKNLLMRLRSRNLQAKDGRILSIGTRGTLNTPEEEDVFRLADLEFIPPEDRR